MPGGGVAPVRDAAYHRIVMRRQLDRDAFRTEWAIVRELALVMRARKLSNVAVARELGMRESSIRAILNGTNRPNLDTVARLVVWDNARFFPLVGVYLHTLGRSLLPTKPAANLTPDLTMEIHPAAVA